MATTDILRTIGNTITDLSQKVLSIIPPEIISSTITARLFSLLAILGIAYLIIHFVSGMKPIVKYLIIIVSALLVISIIFSFTG